MIFCRQEEVLQQVAVHNTTCDASNTISETLQIRPATSASEYDGFDTSTETSNHPNQYNDQLYLPCAYFHVFPKSDQVLYPVSSFPRDLLGGTRTTAVHYNLNHLTRYVEEGRAKLYHVATTPTQYGFKLRRAYQTHVVVSIDGAGEKQLSNCGAVLLNATKNRVFALAYDTGPLARFDTLEIDLCVGFG